MTTAKEVAYELFNGFTKAGTIPLQSLIWLLASALIRLQTLIVLANGFGKITTS